ncbi:cytochrome oxidase Cu insertion factor (SCO1/SenC/PrrC family) [Chitinophaga terrae (ex Kim and Jung 2007)]|uniref:peroxiredoxin family protein n=1 Tax=Chitinophaga terrae (ex Kim and Jung 2007) TaxID=408074 RepID=UPI00277DC71B|nr:redoxin domain-containing protein [Chitinophaga terrae (ex Kim and Jung 2007)]MDQ0105980.1 cytochrome oxidase Cu insertion factor (SCO1/SenC/PrrC family) [Chitinophaga terrae (ex Kim and Jung 2007)]
MSMRYVFLVLFCCISVFSQAQTTSSTTSKPAYLQYPIIPAFPMTLPDGHVITKNDLKKNVKTMVFVFSVDCDHCKHLTEEVTRNIDKFKNVQILMVTPFKVDQMKEYYEQYKIKNYPNIIMASEPTRQIMYFYDLRYFPGLFIYDKKQQLVKGMEGDVKVDTLLSYLNK